MYIDINKIQNKFSIKSFSNHIQSDGNSFWGDLVLKSFMMAYRDEGSILDQKYEKQLFWDLYYGDF